MRYRGVSDDFARVADLYAGVVAFFAPATEAEPVAAALCSGNTRFERRAWVHFESIRTERAGARCLLVGLPTPDAAGDAWLDALNAARDALRTRGILLALVLEPGDMVRFQSRCGDVFSALASAREVPFEPSAGRSLEPARRALASEYRRRFGRLDLRGLVRSDVEDVGWPAELLYQSTRVEPLADRVAQATVDGSPRVREKARPADALVRDSIRASDGRPVVLLGGPGAGKSRYLRHLATTGSERGALFGIRRPLVVLVPLAARARELRVGLREAVLAQLLETCPIAAHALDTAAEAGRLVLLLDGLDEVDDVAGVAAAIVKGLGSLATAVVVVTSRPAGCPGDLLPHARVATLAPLAPDQIRAFLETWCRQYAVDLHGDTAEARADGEREGAALANEVLGRPQLAELAGSPLLLSIIGLVHRTGVRLPDHRVELYAHMTHVLVERWNRFRSEGGAARPPIKLGDAQRMLGPLALRAIASGTRAAFDESWVRDAIAGPAAAGRLDSGVDADAMLRLLRETLGLLVEAAPGRYGFLHASLAEFLAARELLRTESLDAVLADRERVFADAWREVVLLALGELGIVRAQDAAVERAVAAIRSTARKAAPDNLAGVVGLVNGILQDEPGLDVASTDALVDEAAQSWWFRGAGAALGGPWYYETMRLLMDRRDRPDHWSRRLWARCGGVTPAAWFADGFGGRARLTMLPFTGWFPAAWIVEGYVKGAENETFGVHVALSASLHDLPGAWRLADDFLTLRIPARIAALADLRGDMWVLGWHWWNEAPEPELEFTGAPWSSREIDAPVALDAPPEAMVEARLPFVGKRPPEIASDLDFFRR